MEDKEKNDQSEKHPLQEDEQKDVNINEVVQEHNHEEEKTERMEQSSELKSPTNEIETKHLSITPSPQKEKNPQEILQEKLDQMKSTQPQMPDNVLSGVSKGIDDTMRSLEDDIKNDKLKINEISQQIEVLNASMIKKKLHNEAARTLSKNKMKIIEGLKEKETKIKDNLLKLDQQQDLLKNESYLNIPTTNLNLSLNGSGVGEVEENIRKKKLKDIEKSKSVLREKLEDINHQIIQIIERDKAESINKGQLIKEFLLNFERDKELANQRLKELQKESSERYSKYITEQKEIEKEDIQGISGLYDKDGPRLQREEQQRKKAHQKIFIEQQKEAQNRLRELNQSLIDKVNNMPIKQEMRVNIAKRNEEEFKAKQEQIINKEKTLRKEKMRPISFEEIKQFQNQVRLNEAQTMLELEKKKSQLQALWRERRELLPKIDHKDYKELPAIQTENDNIIPPKKIPTREQVIQNMKNMQEKIKKKFKPKFDEKLHNELKERIDRLNQPRKYISHSSYHRKGRVILKKINKNKLSQRLGYVPKLNTIENISTEKKKLKKTDIRIPLDKPIDYLFAIRKERENSSTVISNTTPGKRWDKMLKDKKGNLYYSVETVKSEAEKFQKEAEQKRQLLKIKGGSENDPELGEEISNLYINSITAKLKILQALNDQDTEEIKEN